MHSPSQTMCARTGVIFAILLAAAAGRPARADSYQHDSGSQMQDLFSVGGGHVLMMNRYTALPGRTQITQIEFPWHNAPGAKAEIVIWSDPDNDGLPGNDSVLWSTTINGTGDGEVAFVQVPVPAVSVGAAGSNFFVGFSELTPLLGGQVFTSVSVDPATFLPDRGFGLIDYNHRIIPTELDGFMPIEAMVAPVGPGPATPTLAIRALAIPAPGSAIMAFIVALPASRWRRRL